MKDDDTLLDIGNETFKDSDEEEVSLKEPLSAPTSTDRGTKPPTDEKKENKKSNDLVEKEAGKSEENDSLFKAPDSKMVMGVAGAALFFGILLAPVAPILAVPLIVGAGLGIASQVVDRDVAFSKAKDAKSFVEEKAPELQKAIGEKSEEVRKGIHDFVGREIDQNPAKKLADKLARKSQDTGKSKTGNEVEQTNELLPTPPGLGGGMGK